MDVRKIGCKVMDKIQTAYNSIKCLEFVKSYEFLDFLIVENFLSI
jgi:hypothetical protein